MMPGDKFDVDSDLASTFEYGSEWGTEQAHLIGGNELTVSQSFSPFEAIGGDMIMSESKSVIDKAGRPVLTKHGNDEYFGYLEWKYQYDHGLSNAFNREVDAFSQTTAYTPNYNAGLVDGYENFKNITASLDATAQITVSQEPDLEGFAVAIKDDLGRIRFSRKHVTDLDSSSISGASYIKYDEVTGRISETGVLKNISHSLEGYKTLANDTTFPNNNQSCWQKRYLYDTDVQTGHNQKFLAGRVYGLIGNLNRVLDKPIDDCHDGEDKGKSYIFYKYDQQGRVIGVSEVTETTLRNSAYRYNNLGAKLAVTYPCLLYTSPSPRDRTRSRMPSSA